MFELETVKGSVIEPNVHVAETNFIIHGCNDVGRFGLGVAGAIASKWPHVIELYLRWKRDGHRQLYYGERSWDGLFKQGNIQIIPVDPEYSGLLNVVNMITQSRCGRNKHGQQPFRYGSYEECLYRFLDLYNIPGKSIGVHMPRIGCGLGGAEWPKVKEITERVFSKFLSTRFSATVYEYG